MMTDNTAELRTANQIAYLQLLAATTRPETMSARTLSSVQYLYADLDRKLGAPPGWTPPEDRPEFYRPASEPRP
jgi:hypothetical protein